MQLLDILKLRYLLDIQLTMSSKQFDIPSGVQVEGWAGHPHLSVISM